MVSALTDLERVKTWLVSSLADLAKHHLEVTRRLGESPSYDLRVAQRSDGTQQLQIWWTKVRSQTANQFLWDYIEVDAGMSAPLLREQVLPWVRDGYATVIDTPVDNPLAPSALFAYHPQRMRNHHPLGKVLAQRAASDRGFTIGVIETAMTFLSDGMQPYLAKARLRERVKAPARQEMDFANLAPFYADFHHYGKQIFDFPPEMVSLFSRTDVDGIPLEAIRLPHESFYMHFGPQRELQTEDGWIPDGAYVARAGEGEQQVIQICLTFAPAVPQDYVRFFDHPEPCYVQAITADRMKIGVGEAVDLVLAEKLEELARQQEQGTKGFEQARADLALELEEAGVEVRDRTSANATGERDRIRKLHLAWQTMLRLVVNGIAYLSAYPEDSETRWPQGAPTALTAVFKDGNYKAKSKATGKLAELGYAAINYCGTSFRKAPPATGAEPATGQQVGESFTWVRGHWRRQPYGENRSLRRLTWLMPHRRTVPGADPDAEHGHVYLVT